MKHILLLLVTSVACTPIAQGPETAQQPPTPKVAAGIGPASQAPAAKAPKVSARPVSVRAFSPKGKVTSALQLTVNFDGPVVALQGADEQAADDLLIIDPPVAGTAHWLTPDTLVFNPAHPFPSATRFQVELKTPLRTLGGHAIDRPVKWSFETERPRVTGVTPQNREKWIRLNTAVYLQFSHPISPRSVREAISIRVDGADKALPVRVYRPTRKELDAADVYTDPADVVAVRPKRRLKPGTRLEVRVDEGWTAQLGPLPADAKFKSTFETFGRLQVAQQSCGGDRACELGQGVTIRMTNSLADKSERHVRVQPAPRDLYLHTWGDEIQLDGTFKPDVNYVVTLSGALRDEYGQRLGKAVRIPLTFAQPAPTLALSSSHGLLDAARPTRIGVTTRFLKTVRVERAVIDRATARAAWKRQQDPLLATSYHGVKGTSTVLELLPSGPSEWAAEEIILGAPKGGLALVRVEPERAVNQRALPTPDLGLYGVTTLGLSTVVSAGQSFARVVELAGGEPVAGATVYVWDSAGAETELGTTGDDGLVEIRDVTSWGSRGAMLWAEKGQDAVPLRLAAQGWRAPMQSVRPGARLAGTLIAERGVYKPGEKVHVVGFLHQDVPGSKVGMEYLAEGTELRVKLMDRDGQEKEVAAKSLSARGKFAATFHLPEDAALGRWSAVAALGNHTFSARFKVENYRVPEFSVTATPDAPEYVVGDPVAISIVAEYYSGGGTPIQRIRTQRGCRPVGPLVRGLEPGWTAGAWYDGRWYSGMGLATLNRQPGTDGADGRLSRSAVASVAQEGYAARCVLRAAILDATYQEEGAEAAWNIHPAAAYAALKVPRNPKNGDDGTILFKGVDADGKPAAAGAVRVEITRTWWAPKFGKKGKRTYIKRYDHRTRTVRKCTVDDGGSVEHSCKLGALKQGSYTVTAVAENGGNKAISRDSFWVPSGRWQANFVDPPRGLELHVAPGDRRPGDKVEVVVRAPWPKAHGVFLLNRGGVRERIPFQLAGQQAQFAFDVDDTWVPKVQLEAMLWEPGLAKHRAEVHQKTAWVNVPNSHRRLDVAIELAATAAPRDQVPVKVNVASADGAAVEGRVTIWAVDEAVLSLTDYEVVDLLDALTSTRGAEVGYASMYRRLMEPWIKPSSDPLLTEGMGMSGYGMGAGGAGVFGSGRGAGGVALPVARSKFETTPLFLGDAPVVGGVAETQINLPDNLTTFRVMALATSSLEAHEAPGRAGHAKAMLRVEKPVVMRAALPRQLRPGDSATIAAVVTTKSAQGTPVTVVASVEGTSGAAPFALGETRVETTLGEGGQVRVPFALETLAAGRGRVTLTALVGGDSDGIELPLEVRAEPTAVEHVATYGTLVDAEPVGLPVTPPKRTVGPVKVDLEASATLVGGLRDAARALVQYPYGCLEQTSSRMVPLVALSELGEIGFPLDGVGDVNAFVTAGVERIVSMQTPSGGFAYWPGAKEPNAYATAYAVWVLTLARRAGHKVPEKPFDRAARWLQQQTETPDEDWPDYRIYMNDVRRTIAVHALAEAGLPAPKAVDQLYNRRRDLPRFSQAFLMLAMHATDRADPRIEGLASDLLAAIGQTQSEAHVIETTRWDLSEVFYSSGRTDAIVLMALLAVDPDHPNVVKLARGLLDRRREGTWRNTQENAYAVLGLARYAAAYERETPDFRVKAWASDAPLLDASMTGRAAKPTRGTLEVDSGPDPVSVVLQRTGAGRLYYRLGMSYARPTSDLTTIDRGLGLTTSLRTSGGTLAPNQPVAVGSLIAMDITLSSKTRQRHIAVNLPIPAGLEPVNLSLGGPKVLPLGGTRGWFLSHEELHPDRALVFADDLAAGTHKHTVYLRATTPGRYDMPAARAEAMYAPEVFGRAPGRNLVVTR